MEQAAEAGDRDALVAYDQEFHRALFAAGGRPETRPADHRALGEHPSCGAR